MPAQTAADDRSGGTVNGDSLRLSHLDALTRSSLPSMLLMLLMRVGERDGTEPLGRAVGCLGMLQGALAQCREGDRDTLGPEAQKLGRDAVGALISAIKTLRQVTD